MKSQVPTAVNAIVMALSFWLMTLLLAPSIAMAQETFVIKPVAEKKLKRTARRTLVLAGREFPHAGAGQAAAGPTSLAAEVAGKAWLFTLGAKGGCDARRNQGRRGRARATDHRARVSAAHQQRVAGRRGPRRRCIPIPAPKPSMC